MGIQNVSYNNNEFEKSIQKYLINVFKINN